MKCRADIRDKCVKRYTLVNVVANCGVSQNLFDLHSACEDKLVERLKSDFPLLKIFDPFKVLCDLVKCDLVINGNPLYRDSHRLSKYGSELLGKVIANIHLSHLTNL